MKKILLSFVLCLAAAGCAMSSPAIKEVPDEQTDYTLGVGDAVRITVFGEETLTGEYKVEPNGAISFPLIKEVPAAGYTTGDVEKAITDQLNPTYLVDPRVSVEVINFRNVYVLGEVGQPGKFEFVPNMTVLQAVAMAGGYTYRAQEHRAEITRHVKGALKTFEVDDKTLIKPGDTIVINRRWF